VFKRAWASALLVLERFQEPAGLRRAVRRVIPQLPDVAPPGSNQFLIDVSVLARHNAGTGVQRVTKELLRELVATPPEGYVVRPVQASRWRRYRYTVEANASSTVQVRPGDIFLGLDLASRILPRHRQQLLCWQATGVRLCFVMHDLLPLHHPDWFTRRNARAYGAWIRTIAVHADSVVCVSQYVAGQFQIWLAGQGFDRESAPRIGWFHHGVRLPFNPEAAPTDARVTQIALNPFVLIVGTIEPRKGHAQALDAFEAIWRDSHPMQLVIVGRVGWKVDSLVARLRVHPETGHRLHWFDDADDDTLHALYEAATGVLLASEAEGFGLPILEAAAHRKPLFVRDIPVFREIAGLGATYFTAVTRQEFASELREWVRRLRIGTAVASTEISVQDWAGSARQMVHALLHVQ
jgi:glycosyltransferase involved in cell wall biosynthesis